MDLKTLYDVIPAWDWPEDAAGIFQEILDNPSADPAERLLAAEMAGDLVVMNDELAGTLLAVVGRSSETVELRARAAISFSPVFGHVDLYEFEDPDDTILSEGAFRKIQAALRKLYYEAGVPVVVRRCILEATVMVPEAWHSAAVRAAFACDDEDWQRTAVSCMRFLEGFDRQILAALASGNPDIRYQALLAAGARCLEKAWPVVAGIISDPGGDKTVLLAAIDAAAGIGSPEAIHSLVRLLNSDDDDIVEAAEEALFMLEAGDFGDDSDEEEW
jgi:hypothetical protein